MLCKFDDLVDLLKGFHLTVITEEIPLTTDLNQLTYPIAIISINQGEIVDGKHHVQYYIRVYFPSGDGMEIINVQKSSAIATNISNVFGVEVHYSPIKHSSPLCSGGALTFTVLSEVWMCED